MVQIITDSSVMYTEDEAKAAGFEAIPLCIHIGELEGRDLQIDMEDFYRRIEEGQVPRSSQPPIGEVLDAYARYPQDEIIHISIADGLWVPITVHAVPERWQITKRELRCLTAGLCAVPTGI